MAGVPYTFAGASTTIPLSQLDANFQTPITIGQTNANLGQVVTTISGLTLSNVNITSGNVTISNINVTNVISNNAVITGGTISNTTLTNVTITSLATPLPNNLLANSSVTIGNTSVALGGTIANIGNLSLTNTNISSLATTFPNSFLSNSSVTLGNTTVALGGTTANLGNLTLANVNIQSGNVAAAIPSTNIGNAAIVFGGTTSTIGNLTLTNLTIFSLASTIPNNFLGNSSFTLGNTVVALGGTTSTLGNLSIANLTVISGNVANAIPTTTLGNSTITFGGSTSTVGNLTLINVTINSVSSAITAAQGGTGLTTLPANNLLLGNGTGSLVSIAPGTNGNVLTSNGTVWLSGALPTFSAYQSSAQTLPSATYTKVQYQTVEWDTSSNFDAVTNYRYTPQVAGYYQVSGGIAVAVSPTQMNLVAYKNGAFSKMLGGGATSTDRVEGSAIIYMNGTTDYIEAYAIAVTGQALATGSPFNFFQACLIRRG